MLMVNRFESIYLENLGDQFKQHFLPQEAQVSKIFAFHIEDYDEDGLMDVLLAGNFYATSMYQGRYDASYGLMLKGNADGSFESIGVDCGFLLKGEVRDIKTVRVNKENLILVAGNNSPLKLFKRLWTNKK